MTLTDEVRHKMYTRAVNHHPSLGGLFQNEMDIKQSDIQIELLLIDKRFTDLLDYYKSVKALETITD